MFFFFNDTATTEIYTLSLHDALPISAEMCTTVPPAKSKAPNLKRKPSGCQLQCAMGAYTNRLNSARSEEHTSELQSRQYLVCRLLLEKKKNIRSSQESRQSSIRSQMN